MKKLMFLFLMVIGLMSSLAALDTGQIGCDVQKSQTLSETDGVKSTPASATTAKVNILHRDNLMYSLGEGGLDKLKIIWTSGCNQNTKTDRAYATVAVVCYPRGEHGA